jgi:hypothetical protein
MRVRSYLLSLVTVAIATVMMALVISGDFSPSRLDQPESFWLFITLVVFLLFELHLNSWKSGNTSVHSEYIVSVAGGRYGNRPDIVYVPFWVMAITLGARGGFFAAVVAAAFPRVADDMMHAWVGFASLGFVALVVTSITTVRGVRLNNACYAAECSRARYARGLPEPKHRSGWSYLLEGLKYILLGLVAVICYCGLSIGKVFGSYSYKKRTRLM